MCGILAIIDKSNSLNEEQFLNYLKIQEHRGYDNIKSKKITSGKYTVYLGINHLAITELESKQLHNNNLIFNGEIYNYKEISNNYNLDNYNESEVISFLLDNNFDLSQMSGMFALIFYKNGYLDIARDFYGKKPLFYFVSDETIIFASEINTIKKIIHKQSINFKHLLQFIETSYYNKSLNETIYKDIKEIPKNKVLRFDINKFNFISKKKIYHKPKIGKLDQVKNDLFSSISKRVANIDENLKPGLAFSGGVDSSLIFQFIDNYYDYSKFKFFTIDFGIKNSDFEYVLNIHRKRNLDLVIVDSKVLYQNFFDYVDRIILAHGKPIQFSGNNLGMFLIYEKANDCNTKVMIDGTGGDEIFFGYINSFFYKEYLDGNLRSKNYLSILFFLLTQSSNLSNFTMYIKYIFHNAGKNHKSLIFTQLKVINKILRNWLDQNDLNAMHFNIENRSPFCDQSLFQYVFMEDKFKLSYSNKPILRSVSKNMKNSIPSIYNKKGLRLNVRFGHDNYPEHVKNTILKSEICKKFKLNNFNNLSLYSLARFEKLILDV